MNEDDEIRLRHMLDAAREAVAFSQGRVRADLRIDRQLRWLWSRKSRLSAKPQPQSGIPRALN